MRYRSRLHLTDYRALLAIALVAASLVSLSAIRMTATTSASPSSESGLLDHLETQFNPTYQSVRRADFVPRLSLEEAVSLTIDYFMDGFGIPKGRGAEAIIKSDAVTAIYSGAKGGFGEWEIFDRPVWVIVLYDLPITLPGGRGGPDSPPPPEDGFIKYYQIVDADSGEGLSGSTQGWGRVGSNWDGIDLSRAGIDQ